MFIRKTDWQMSNFSRKLWGVGGTKKDEITVSLSLKVSNFDIYIYLIFY